MFETVLVADRGLPAVRVIAGCQRLGIYTVTCVADGDDHALHARTADEVIHLGARRDGSSEAGAGAQPDVAAVVEAARVCGAAAVHPGGASGARDTALARRVLDAGLIWVGGRPDRCVPSWRPAGGRRTRTLLWESGPPADPDPAWTGRDRLVEAVTGTDLVERQLRYAAGEALEPLPAASGYAVQAVLYAGAGTLVPVEVRGWQPPEMDGVVVDTVLGAGAWLTRYDDAVLARVTARGHDREQALVRVTAAVDAIELTEPAADLAGLRALLREPSVTR